MKRKSNYNDEYVKLLNNKVRIDIFGSNIE